MVFWAAVVVKGSGVRATDDLLMKTTLPRVRLRLQTGTRAVFKTSSIPVMSSLTFEQKPHLLHTCTA